MGRNRIRTEEENKIYDKEYQRLYKLSRKTTDSEYYKASASRSYYRKVLKNMNSDNPRYEIVSQKVSNLDQKINELLSTRNRYARMDICEKVDAIIATN